MLNLSSFTYHLPPERIAQEAAVPRDHARLMLIDRTSGKISHHYFYELPTLLPQDYHLVVNNTKVFPARLRGHKKTGGKVEVLLTSSLGNSLYKCLTKPGLDIGDTVTIGGNLHVVVTEADPTHEIERIIKFDQEESILRTLLSEYGEMPTPPYIKKMLENVDEYQTIYAKYGFSAAAPTAGLHFTEELMDKIKQDFTWDEVTLDVGLGTFLPVKVEDITKHAMHSEHFSVDAATAARLNGYKADGDKILAVGTTTMRTLESAVQNGQVIPGIRDTSIFIYPPHQFEFTGALLTNFHLPESTLLMLVSAFCSAPNTDVPFTQFEDSLLGRAYQIAIEQEYRFFSFGDAMLII